MLLSIQFLNEQSNKLSKKDYFNINYQYNMLLSQRNYTYLLINLVCYTSLSDDMRICYIKKDCTKGRPRGIAEFLFIDKCISLFSWLPCLYFSNPRLSTHFTLKGITYLCCSMLYEQRYRRYFISLSILRTTLSLRHNVHAVDNSWLFLR